MSEQEALLKHRLKLKVELELYKELKLIGEGSKIEDIDAARQESIDYFLENLPEEYKKLPDYKEIVFNTLNIVKKKEVKKEETER